jgi:caa(3)-type oxidase subunit IV
MDREILYKAARTPAFAFIGLLAFLGLNIWFAFLPVDPTIRLSVKITLCFLTALTLMVFCMHLHRATGLVRLTAAVGFLWLALMIGLIMADVLNRAYVPAPW